MCRKFAEIARLTVAAKRNTVQLEPRVFVIGSYLAVPYGEQAAAQRQIACSLAQSLSGGGGGKWPSERQEHAFDGLKHGHSQPRHCNQLTASVHGPGTTYVIFSVPQLNGIAA